ncbi:MAG: hypothetical protein QNJ72_24325 [Pleurocapsa sp. MO_226.B13]|nr:hypothetical protein [Pleurocapsa sp. MO_226.B13]
MKTLLELERIATTVRHSLPPPRKTPRRERRAREREQLRQMKRTAVGSDIQSNKRRKDFGKPGF